LNDTMGARPVPTTSARAAPVKALGVKRTASSLAKRGGGQPGKFLQKEPAKQFVAAFAGPSSSDAGTYFSPSKGDNVQTLDMLAALTATPVRAKLDQDEDGSIPANGVASPCKDAVMSPLSFPSQCKRRRTAAAMAASVYANQHLGLLIPNAVWASSQLGVGGFPTASASAALFPQMGATVAGTSEVSPAQQALDATPLFAETLSALPGIVGEQEAGSTKWLDLVVNDIKGRLAALKRSKGRIAKVQEKATNELLIDMQNKLEVELLKLQRLMKEVKEMQSMSSTQALLSTAIKLSYSSLYQH